MKNLRPEIINEIIEILNELRMLEIRHYFFLVWKLSFFEYFLLYFLPKPFHQTAFA